MYRKIANDCKINGVEDQGQSKGRKNDVANKDRKVDRADPSGLQKFRIAINRMVEDVSQKEQSRRRKCADHKLSM